MRSRLSIAAAAVVLAASGAFAEPPAPALQPAEVDHVEHFDVPVDEVEHHGRNIGFVKVQGMGGLDVQFLPGDVLQLQAMEDPAAPGEKLAYLGVATTPLQPDARKELGLPRGLGLRVMRVEPGSPAAAGGLQEQDVLLRLNDQQLFNEMQLRSLVRSFKVGDEVTLSIVRGKEPKSLKAKMAEMENRLQEAVVMPLPGMPPEFGGAGQIRMVRIEGNMVQVGPDGTRIEVTHKGDDRHLKATDAAGKVIFDGPINTDEEKKKVPEGLQRHIQDLPQEGVAAARAQAVRARRVADVLGEQRLLWAQKQNEQRIDWSDGEVDLTLTIKRDGKEPETHLLVKDDTGKLLYDGPFDTRQQRDDVARNLQEKVMLALLKNFKDTGGAMQPIRIRFTEPVLPGGAPPQPAPVPAPAQEH